METYKKIQNGASMVVGGALMFLSIRSLLHHQSIFFSSKGQKMVPTFIPALLGAWLLVFGLLGFIQKRTR